jgi:hypothetical protein
VQLKGLAGKREKVAGVSYTSKHEKYFIVIAGYYTVRLSAVITNKADKQSEVDIAFGL